jgi:DNA-binding MarR family transcriptional regulator
MTNIPAVEPDQVDVILEQWGRERPDVDASAMAIIGRISRLEQMIRPQLDRVFEQHQLESWEFDVLATLRRSGRPYRLTAGQLQDSMMITSGAVTNRIDRLEQRGLIRREKDPTDGRRVLVALTTDGLGKIDSALPDHAANEAALVEALSSRDRRTLIRLLRSLHHAVADVDG